MILQKHKHNEIPKLLSVPSKERRRKGFIQPVTTLTPEMVGGLGMNMSKKIAGLHRAVVMWLFEGRTAMPKFGPSLARMIIFC